MKNTTLYTNELSLEFENELLNDFAINNGLDIEELDASDIINDYLYYDYQDIKDNLTHTVDNDIIAIADLGLWNGRRLGYRELDNNLSSILQVIQGDYVTLKTDRYNLTMLDTHHDGTNFYTFRKFKDISDDQRDRFLDKLYNGTATKKDISRYTTSLLQDIQQAYGY